MAYVPPHKRHTGEGEAPTPESMAPLIRRTLNFRSHSGNKKNMDLRYFRIVYDQNATSRWFPVGLGSCFGYGDGDADKFMSFTKLEPFTAETIEKNLGPNPRALTLDHDRINEYDGERGMVLEDPWDFIAENVKGDLVSAIQRVQEKMKDNDCELIKPSLVVRFGRVIFRGEAPTRFRQCNLGELKESFNTTLSPLFVEHVIDHVFPKLGADHAKLKKELFVVGLSDSTELNSTISCKCNLGEDGKTLELYKIEFNQERHFVSDISCLGKNLDLRLMLLAKKTVLNAFTDDEIESIKSLIGSAVVDPEVKGGVRWPLGRNSCGNPPYTVSAVWHVKARIVKNSSVRLKLRRADRFNFGSSSGEVSSEVSMRIYDVMSQLQMQPIREDLIADALRSCLKLIWNTFVCFPSTT